MGREPDAKPVQILYIGRADPSHEKSWQQFQREGLGIAFARTQKLGLEMANELHPQIVAINTANSQFSGERLSRTLGRRLPGLQRLLIVDRGVGAEFPCEMRLVRPFTGHKLRESLMKLLSAAAPNILQAGPLQLDLIGRVVTSPQGKQHLTPKQCDLLATLMQRPNQVLSRRDLMGRIWDTEYLGDTRTLDVHIRWLREKIEVDPTQPRFLQTRRKVGYVLTIPELEAPSEDPVETE